MKRVVKENPEALPCRVSIRGAIVSDQQERIRYNEIRYNVFDRVTALGRLWEETRYLNTSSFIDIGVGNIPVTHGTFRDLASSFEVQDAFARSKRQ